MFQTTNQFKYLGRGVSISSWGSWGRNGFDHHHLHSFLKRCLMIFGSTNPSITNVNPGFIKIPKKNASIASLNLEVVTMWMLNHFHHLDLGRAIIARTLGRPHSLRHAAVVELRDLPQNRMSQDRVLPTVTWAISWRSRQKVEDVGNVSWRVWRREIDFRNGHTKGKYHGILAVPYFPGRHPMARL